jgi:hypothetical protein
MAAYLARLSQAPDGCVLRPHRQKYQLLTCLVALAALSGLSSCADIRFERSPYALRALDIVYSDQEDMTFLVWRLRDSADPSRVRFELLQEGAYVPIALEDAPFPAAPYACDQYYLCFQYQLPGRVRWGADELPVRSIHEQEGIYGGSEPTQRLVGETVDMEPIAIQRNETIATRRYDWFAVEGIPLERGYEYQLVASSAGYGEGPAELVCDAMRSDRWISFDEELTLDHAWVESPRCLVIRPKREDGVGGAEVVRVMPPSAELSSESQIYKPPILAPAPIYLYLTDLLIRSEERCLRAQREIMRTLDNQFSTRSPGAVRLGPFFPLDPLTGEAKDGCQQASAQDYPVQQIVDAVERARARLPEEDVTRVVIIYMNNADLPPSLRVLFQLQMLQLQLSELPGVSLYSMAIASNTLLSIEYEWQHKIGWRPIDDETLSDDLTSWSKAVLPFRTMDHTRQTPILIPAPQSARGEPEFFKICASSPEPLSIRLGQMGRLQGFGRNFYAWPEGDVPSYYIELPEQIVVPYKEYKNNNATLEVEVCERFCDQPFRSSNGDVFSNWLLTSRCQREGGE